MGRAGIFFYAIPTSSTNADTLWVTDVEVGVLVWKLIGGTGASTTTAMKYFVNNSKSSDPQPRCLYSTIAAAISAWVADGHDASSPAVIWLCPSATFTENVTMLPGMSIKGMVDGYRPLTSLGSVIDTLPQITGAVDLGDGSNSLSCVRVAGKVINTGTSVVNQVIDNVEVVSGNSQVALENINANAKLFLHRVSLIGTELPGIPALQDSRGAAIEAVDCDIRGASDSSACIQLTGTFPSGIYSFTNTTISGIIDADGVSAATFDKCNITSSGSSPFGLQNNASIYVYRSIVDNADPVTVGGTGNYTFIDNSFPSGMTAVAPTVTTNSFYTNRGYSETDVIFEVASYAVTELFDLYTIDSTATGSGVTPRFVTLPSLNTVPFGTRLTFQRVIHTGIDVTIVRSGSDTINGEASNILMVAGTLQGVTLQAGRTDWRKVAYVAG